MSTQAQLELVKQTTIDSLISHGFSVDKAKATGDGKSKLRTPRQAINDCSSVREVNWHFNYFLSPEGFR